MNTVQRISDWIRSKTPNHIQDNFEEDLRACFDEIAEVPDLENTVAFELDTLGDGIENLKKTIIDSFTKEPNSVLGKYKYPPPPPRRTR